MIFQDQKRNEMRIGYQRSYYRVKLVRFKTEDDVILTSLILKTISARMKLWQYEL